MNLQPYYITALLFTAIANFCLGIFVYLKGREKLLNQIHAFFCFCITIWAYGQAEMMITTNAKYAFFCAQYEHAAVFFIAASYAHFVFRLTGGIKKKKHIIIFSYFLSCIFLILLYTTRSILSGVDYKFSHSYFGEPGPLYVVFLAVWTLTVSYSLLELFNTYKKSEGEKKNRIKYVFWGTLIGYVGGCGNYFLIFDLELFPYTPFGTYGVTIYTFMMAYAILQHHLFDINIAIRRTLVYSSLATFLTFIYLILVVVAERFFRGAIGYTSFLSTIVASLFIAICFIPLKNKIQYIIDRVFFKTSLEQIAEENERLRQEMLKQDRMKAVATLAAGMAHEIKNPLTVIKTFAEYLPEKYNDEKFMKKFSRLITPQVERINFTVQQLLSFSKLAKPNIKSVDISETINEILELLNEDFIKSNIKAEAKHGNGKLDVSADQGQLKEVFLNLFLNSIDAMPKGGTLTVSTDLVQNGTGGSSSKSNGGWIEVNVRDTGCGISKETKKRLFEPFYTTKLNGTGLGLSVIRDILDLHNAKISVESEENQGTSFIIKFPVKN